MIPVYTPRIYKDSAIKALESGWVSSQGEYMKKATDALSKLFNIPYVILMNNGTSATHMLLKALNFKYPTLRKLYVPNNVFVAVWNVCLYDNFFELEVLKMSPETLNMRIDEEYIQSLAADSAVLVVHNVGNIVNVPRLKRLRPDLIFIEDNCEGLFGRYEEIYSGMSEASLCSACSFFANKIITSGEGGAFFTHDKEVYDFIYSTMHHGVGDQKFIHPRLGYNYRMTNIQAAMLYDQIQHADSILHDKYRVFSFYKQFLEGYDIALPQEDVSTRAAPWMFLCGIKKPYIDIYSQFHLENIEIRPFFYDIQAHTHLSSIPREQLSLDYTYIMLPSFPDLSAKQLERVVCVLKNIIEPKQRQID